MERDLDFGCTLLQATCSAGSVVLAMMCPVEFMRGLMALKHFSLELGVCSWWCGDGGRPSTFDGTSILIRLQDRGAPYAVANQSCRMGISSLRETGEV